MAGKRQDEDREARIENEIVVDAYDASERAMGWYYYLEEKFQFPFTARCLRARGSKRILTASSATVATLRGVRTIKKASNARGWAVLISRHTLLPHSLQ